MKRVHDGLMSMAKSWATANSKKSEELLTGNRLAEAIALLESHSSWLSDEERSYLEASRVRAAWRNRAEMGAVVLLTLLAGVAGWFAFSATKAKELAQKQLQQATSLRLAIEGPAIVTQTRAGSILQGALLASVAHRYQLGGEAYSGLLLVRDFLRQTSHIVGLRRFVWTVALSPDGTRIVSGSDENTLRLWDATTGHSIGEPLKGHRKIVQSVAFSPDGTRIVSGSNDATLRLWDASTGDRIGEPLKGHTDIVNSVAFSPNSVRIISGSNDATLRLWHSRTGSPIGEPLKGHTGPVFSVAYSPDSTA